MSVYTGFDRATKFTLNKTIDSVLFTYEYLITDAFSGYQAITIDDLMSLPIGDYNQRVNSLYALIKQTHVDFNEATDLTNSGRTDSITCSVPTTTTTTTLPITTTTTTLPPSILKVYDALKSATIVDNNTISINTTKTLTLLNYGIVDLNIISISTTGGFISSLTTPSLIPLYEATGTTITYTGGTYTDSQGILNIITDSENINIVLSRVGYTTTTVKPIGVIDIYDDTTSQYVVGALNISKSITNTLWLESKLGDSSIGNINLSNSNFSVSGITSGSTITNNTYDDFTIQFNGIGYTGSTEVNVSRSDAGNTIFFNLNFVEGALKLTWDNILNVPVANAASVSDWNTFFNLPTNGGEFTSVAINGNVVNLYGGSNINLVASLFEIPFAEHIIKFEDGADCIVSVGFNTFGGDEGSQCINMTTLSLPAVLTVDAEGCMGLSSLTSLYVPLVTSAGNNAFSNCTILTTINLPSLLTIGDQGMKNNLALTTINLPLCTNLGTTTDDDFVFYNIIGNSITLTVHSDLMTCDGGSPDVDIQYLIDNNNVTINGVSYIPRTLTVNHGIGSGVYIQNNIVPISAGTSTIEYLWSAWTGDTTYINNVTGSTTYVTMPDADVTIDATYTQDTAFIFKATMPATAVTLPLPSGVYTYNFTVDWGDGSALGTVTSYNDVDAIHTYATSGNTYYVKIKGMCQGFSVNNGTFKTYIKEINNWGTCDFRKLDFYGCNSLTTLPSGSMTGANNITNFTDTFNGCNSLTTIPTDLFKYNTGVTASAFYNTFHACSGLTSIPTDLFKYNTLVSGQAFRYTFGACTSLTSIPSGLFDYNTGVTTNGFDNTFSFCPSLTSIPTDLFKFNTVVPTFSYTFAICTSLTSIPSGLFDHNTLVSNAGFQSTFEGCNSLTSIPSGLFDHNTLVSGAGFYNTFYGCHALTSIPTDLFKYNTGVTTNGFTQTFYNCTHITSIPSGLFDYNTLVSGTAFQYTFTACYALTSIPNGLFDHNTGVTSFLGTFQGCTSLTSIPTGLFNYNTGVTHFSSTFYGCVNITSMPSGLFDYNTLVSQFSYTFQGCEKLASIPTDLFKYNTLVSTNGFYGTFHNCRLLTSIPSGLFDYNTLVSTYGFNYTFSFCYSLTSIPADLFKYNTLVSTYGFDSTFYYCLNLTSIPSGLFDYNTLVSTGGFNSTFTESTKLSTIPDGLFKYNVNCYSFVGTFSGCNKLQVNPQTFCLFGEESTRFLNQSINFTHCFKRIGFTGIQGQAPDLWNYNFGTGTTLTSFCYGYAGNSLTSLSNYADIPTNWKT